MSDNQNQFLFVGNHLAVDFVNTQIIKSGQLHDLLDSPKQLANWLEATTLSGAAKWSAEEFFAATKLRAAISDLLQSRIESRPANRNSIKIVNSYLEIGLPAEKLVADGIALRLSSRRARLTPEMTLASLARSAATLAATADPTSLKSCANQRCVLLFLDLSRGTRRRWCQMKVCGNREKAAAHYQSHRQPD